ncbi:mannosyltransferase [Scheffersomyces spartinae]|uniref:Mannosyltransferase n=1 Tax=Scheffersomyces spartinae TaxID=45513 RepID=A0A9P8AKQ0_9ASCO|nr:mannosyltransferase [Scheffersomyces spartinae]KAG7196172.1 mannosyltransferase [Scheffersomyces spartinae]
MTVRFSSKIRIVLAVLFVLEVIQLLYSFGDRSGTASRWMKPMLMFMADTGSEENVNVVPPKISKVEQVKQEPVPNEKPSKQEADNSKALTNEEPSKKVPSNGHSSNESPAKENPAMESLFKEEPNKADTSKQESKPNIDNESSNDTNQEDSTDEEFKKVNYTDDPKGKQPSVKGNGAEQGPGSKAEPFKSQEEGNSLKSVKDLSIFFNDFNNYKIDAESIKDQYKDRKAHEKFAGDKDFLFSKEYLENVLDIPQDTFNKLKDSHTRYVNEQIPKILQSADTFGSALKRDKSWNDYEKTNGYVLIGGDKYSWLSYLVIRQLRATGAEYPIELFIPTQKDYDEEFCNTVLPRYNARCNIFDYDLTKSLKADYGINGYQYKMLALLSSKFENVMYLDSDNFPARNPDYLFSLTLYKEKGLILWPDAWARTTNPKFFDIAGVKVNEKKIRYSKYDHAEAKRLGLDDVKPLDQYSFKDSHFHDFEGTLPNPTSETGMLLINKTSHLKTLLLCLYYNVFGPKFYYPLMTQGSAGEGDKETFISAAHVMNQSYYQTAKGFRWTGYVNKETNKFQSKALAHHDPIKCLETTDDSVDILFMHLSYPKFYPGWLADNNDLVYKTLGEHIRMYGSIYKNVGYDFDLRVLQFFTQGICKNFYDKVGSPIDDTPNIDKSEYMGEYLSYIKRDEEANSIKCEKVFIPHLKWLKETVEEQYKEKSVKV